MINLIQQKNIKLDCSLTIDDQKVNIQEEETVSLITKPYEIIPEYTKQSSRWCQAIAFNREQTIMIAGGWSIIIVFEFKQGQMKQKQLLKDHNIDYNIRTLYFMTNFNQFLSGSIEEVGIWNYDNSTQKYYCQQMLKQAHKDVVNRVIMNKNEDLIISCSNDKKIKFWIRKDEWECLKILTYHKSCVFNICLNESCTQLVSCDQSGNILISQQGGDQKWRKIQRIQSSSGYRICFINDNLIVFQPSDRAKMEIYELNQEIKQFIKYKDVGVTNQGGCECWFPMQFNKQKKLLMNKNGSRVNLIRYTNNEFIFEQSIEFGTDQIYGAMTFDFQYLVTYDQSNEFQVRKQK